MVLHVRKPDPRHVGISQDLAAGSDEGDPVAQAPAQEVGHAVSVQGVGPGHQHRGELQLPLQLRPVDPLQLGAEAAPHQRDDEHDQEAHHAQEPGEERVMDPDAHRRLASRPAHRVRAGHYAFPSGTLSR